MATIVGTGSGTLASLIPDLSDTSNIQTALKQLYYGTSNGTASQTTGVYGALYTLYTGNPTLSGVVTLGAQSSQFGPSLILTDSTHTTSRRAGIQLGSQWQVGQDSSGLAAAGSAPFGTRDFYIYGHNAFRFGITPEGVATIPGRLSLHNVVNTSQTVETGTATLTAADIFTKNIFVSSGTFTLTLDTGTNFDSALAIPTVGTAANIGTTIEWVVINDGAGTITVQGGTGHTLRGSGTVSATSAARFITRKSAANTYVTYRL